jgi:hypothetical protein
VAPLRRQGADQTVRKLELIVEPMVIASGRVVVSARLEGDAAFERRIWFGLEDRHRDAVTDRADPFVLAALYPAMRDGILLRVRGAPISPGLRANLAELMHVWRQWRGFDVVEIEAEEAGASVNRPREAVTAFSGGIDSAYTALRHATGRRGTSPWGLAAGLMVHGFDIPLEADAGFARAAERADRMLASIGVELITVATNARHPKLPWQMSHGLCVASALTVVSGRFGAGLIAASGTYAPIVLPWGSNLITDPLMGSGDFRIIHDGLHADRYEKVVTLAAWPEARRWLRICWRDPRFDRNCGRCTKCVNSYLLFRVAGVEPECFDGPISIDTILEVARGRPGSGHALANRKTLVEAAATRRIREPWVRAMRRSARRQDWVNAYRMVRPRWMRGRYVRARSLLRRLRSPK